MIDVDARISAALDAAAETVQDGDLRPDLAVPARDRRRWAAPSLAAAAVLFLCVALALVTTRHDAATSTAAAGATSAAPVSASDVLPSGSRAPTGACTSTVCPDPDVARAAFQFVQDSLGFTGLGAGSPSVIQMAGDSWVVLGSGEDAHVNLSILVTNAPADESGLWQLSGTTGLPTDGTPMTVDVPAYGAHVSGAVTVAGSAPGQTGTVRVAVLASGSTTPIATGQADLDADGNWQTGLTLPDTASGPLTVVASLGGTDTTPDEFAVTGVYGG